MQYDIYPQKIKKVVDKNVDKNRYLPTTSM